MADIAYVFGVIASLALAASVVVMLYFTFAAGHSVEPQGTDSGGSEEDAGDAEDSAAG